MITKKQVTCTVDKKLMADVSKLQKVYRLNVSEILNDALQKETDRLKKAIVAGFGIRGLTDIGIED